MVVSRRLGERQLHAIRWCLLAGWLVLIASLFIPAVQAPAWLAPSCPEALEPACLGHGQPGNRLFWGTVVPLGLLLIGVVSHEFWRRICPLAFVSQLARALGRQRTTIGKRGRPEVVLVTADSWLGRHHLEFQWSLFMAGLCLRLLLVNGNPLALAILLVGTLLAAVVVGWAYGGKAWCQYICPMGPVQQVLTGMRGPLGSRAHVGARSRITQSMCRSVSADGHEHSVCVACQAPCIDIDAERAFWQNLRGKPGLGWAFTSYPGLVVGFFWLMEASGNQSGLEASASGYLRSGLWAFDADLPQRAMWPLVSWFPVPRLLLFPLLLTVAAWLSVLLFRGVQGGLERRYRRQQRSQPSDLAIQHTRLLASFVAINEFFWFADPSLGLLGDRGTDVIRSLVLAASAIVLHRSWSRDQATYRRESASESLRRQLRDLPGLDAALDGRALEALSPQEVFTLVKAFPAMGRHQSRSVYRDVMVEMLQEGRLSSASALLELQELRQILQLEESDHHEVLRGLAREQPDLLQQDRLECQVEALRKEAAEEGIRNVLKLAGVPLLELDRLGAPLQEELEKLRQKSGLNDQQWQDLLESFGPGGALEQQRLAVQVDRWLQEAGLRAQLAGCAVDAPLLQPLVRVLDQRLDGARNALDQRLAAAGLAALPAASPAAGSLDHVFELLWSDPDPDTAGWVLMLARERDSQLAARLMRESRAGFEESAFLKSQRQGLEDPDRAEFPFLAAADLFGDLLPKGILWVARQGHLRELKPGEQLFEQGAVTDAIALVLAGDLRLLPHGGPMVVLTVGQTVGEMGVIRQEPQSCHVHAGPEGARLFVLPAQAFEELLQRSRRFGRRLMTDLADRLAAATPVLANR